ncbi:unnamed protein product, partial [Allacma fusca]
MMIRSGFTTVVVGSFLLISLSDIGSPAHSMKDYSGLHIGYY